MSIAFQFQVSFQFTFLNMNVYFNQYGKKKKLEISKLLAKKLDVNFAVNGVEKSFNLEAFICWHHAYMHAHSHLLLKQNCSCNFICCVIEHIIFTTSLEVVSVQISNYFLCAVIYFVRIHKANHYGNCIKIKKQHYKVNVWFIFFAFQIPQGSPFKTYDVTISSAPGTKFLVYQEVIFVSEKHSLQVLYVYEIEKFPFPWLSFI